MYGREIEKELREMQMNEYSRSIGTVATYELSSLEALCFARERFTTVLYPATGGA